MPPSKKSATARKKSAGTAAKRKSLAQFFQDAQLSESGIGLTRDRSLPRPAIDFSDADMNRLKSRKSR